jgi:hypothetical protein
MRARSIRAALLWTAIMVPAVLAQSAPPRVDPAEWAPPEALVFVGITDVGEFWRGLEKTAMFQLLRDPAVREASGQWAIIGKFVDGFRERLSKLLQTDASNLRSPFGGPLGAYLKAGPEGFSAPPEGALIAGVSDRELMKDYYGKILERFRSAASRHETLSFAAQDIEVFESDDSDASKEEDFEFEADDASDEALSRMVGKLLDQIFAPDSMPSKIALCLTEDRLIVSGTADSVREVLRSDRERSLRGTEDYQALGRKFGSLGTLRFLVNVPRIVELSMAKADEEERAWLNALGLRALGSFIGHVQYGDEQVDGRAEALLMLTGDRSGIPKILSMKNREVEPARSVSADTVFFVSINLNTLELLEEIERMLRQTDPEAADRMRASLQNMTTPSGPLDLRKELFENLREPLTFGLSFARPLAPDSARLLMTLAHRDKAAMDRLLSTFQGLMPGMLTAREQAGTQVYDFGMVGVSLVAAADAVLIGSTTAVEASLNASVSESLASDSAFRRAARFTPREAWGTVYVDSRKMMEAALGMVKHRAALEAAPFNPTAMVALGILKQFTGDMEESKTDAFRRLARYYAPSLLTIETTADGIRMVSVQLKPEPE